MLQLTRTHELTDNSHATHISVFMYNPHCSRHMQCTANVHNLSEASRCASCSKRTVHILQILWL